MSECLSVSIHVATTPIPGDERAKMLDDFIATRIRAETDQAGSRDLQMSEPAKQQQGMAWVASYNGFHPESQRRFSSFTIVNGTLIANFYYEALDCSAESFEERRKNLLGSVGVAD
ncbi:MAG: hypothetical protein CMJ58_14585 [Planctomycetaceae bacterium]|nr:hypothetical protein [Planctomycetaceae bacterium]